MHRFTPSERRLATRLSSVEHDLLILRAMRSLLTLLFCASVFLGCGHKQPAAKPLAGPPEAGGKYSLNDGEGGFRVAKVVVSEDDVIFVHLFGNRWKSRPGPDALKVLKAPMPVAYSPETFAGLQPVHLKDDDVSVDERQTFAEWKKSKAAVF
jgi:hypothetical protein